MEREREAREREAHEREARERERKLEAEHERRLREEKERERREAEEERVKLERATKLEQRLGKRGSYQDSPSFDVSKRQAVHDLRGNSLDSYSRRSMGDSGGGSVGYRLGSGGVSGGLGWDRHLESVSYPMSGMGKGGQNSSQSYQKTSGNIGGGVTVVQKGGLSRQNQEIISAALANIQKSVSQSSTAASSQAMRMAGASPIQQVSPGGHMASLGDFVSLGNRGQSIGGQMSSMGGVGRPLIGGVGGMGKPVTKLPPEEERYNRRFSRPSHGSRQPNVKRF